MTHVFLCSGFDCLPPVFSKIHARHDGHCSPVTLLVCDISLCIRQPEISIKSQPSVGSKNFLIHDFAWLKLSHASSQRLNNCLNWLKRLHREPLYRDAKRPQIKVRLHCDLNREWMLAPNSVVYQIECIFQRWNIGFHRIIVIASVDVQRTLLRIREENSSSRAGKAR